jgi:hypothetical protein
MNVRDYAKVIESLEKNLHSNTPNGIVTTVSAGTGDRRCRPAIDSPGAEAAGRGLRRAFGPEVHR